MCLELTQKTSLQKSFAITVMSVTLQYNSFYTSSVPDAVSADGVFSQNLSPLLEEGPTSKRDQVSQGQVLKVFSPGKNLLSNLFIFTLQSEQKLTAIHHARISMALLGMKYQQNSA